VGKGAEEVDAEGVLDGVEGGGGGRAVADASFEEIAGTAEMLYAAMAGATRAVLEGGATPKMVRSLREQLTVLCAAYLAAAGSRVMALG